MAIAVKSYSSRAYLEWVKLGQLEQLIAMFMDSLPSPSNAVLAVARFDAKLFNCKFVLAHADWEGDEDALSDSLDRLYGEGLNGFEQMWRSWFGESSGASSQS